jgi:succinate-acetate transporter protein
MTLGLAYWILMLIWFVFGLLVNFGGFERAWGIAGNLILLFVLFVLLGWQVFGAPLHK